jgi:glycosyltransferase involved in cell wall biosynthesis
VHQLLAALSYGDAIGNEALAIRDRLRHAGFESEIFAEHVQPRMVGSCRPLWRYREVSSPDTVCLFHFSIGSAAGRLVYPLPDRLVAIYHNITPAEFFLGFHPHLAGLCYHGRRELAAFARRSELGLGDSDFNRRELEAAGYRRTAVLPIVHDFERYDGPRSAVVRRLYGDGRTNILFVGRVIPNKRIDDLIRVFAVYKGNLDWSARLLLVGDYRGHERYLRRLQEMIERYRLEDVVLAGHVDEDELRAYYSVADVFLCLSEHEGYCVPVVEAMYFGVPVVAFDAGAVRETLRGGGVLLSSKERPEEVAHLVHEIVSSPALRRSVLETQRRAIAGLRAIDFGALLLERLQPVLEERR